jgi:anti-anti-sigma factor
VALGLAASDPRFAADPYIVQHRPRSVLCVPLLHRGRLTGLLYLENNLTPVAFSRTRIELVRILAAQTAISIENARLFRAADEAAERTRRTNELLESQVLARTSELQSKNALLEATNQQLQREFAERSRAEKERSTIQDQMLRAQEERVAELSSPLIPITDRIVVMPLIGSMDSTRAARVLEAVLEGVQRLRVSVVILDITGLRQVDSATAEMLLRTARALRLLGAQALLTGIRAEVAQTLVALGVDLALIQTRSNLQTGIAYALQLTGTRLSG